LLHSILACHLIVGAGLIAKLDRGITVFWLLHDLGGIVKLTVGLDVRAHSNVLTDMIGDLSFIFLGSLT
jgi:hypothetical protein